MDCWEGKSIGNHVSVPWNLWASCGVPSNQGFYMFYIVLWIMLKKQNTFMKDSQYLFRRFFKHLKRASPKPGSEIHFGTTCRSETSVTPGGSNRKSPGDLRHFTWSSWGYGDKNWDTQNYPNIKRHWKMAHLCSRTCLEDTVFMVKPTRYTR